MMQEHAIRSKNISFRAMVKNSPEKACNIEKQMRKEREEKEKAVKRSTGGASPQKKSRRCRRKRPECDVKRRSSTTGKKTGRRETKDDMGEYQNILLMFILPAGEAYASVIIIRYPLMIYSC
ncbi:hypothetical protein E2C01_023630 [Portunus trituberculatus]|uniref:Uncharacterized protein n=1 Tax=Portunus trituberculatus TaxID=210409 RepID=A0A5B7EAD1_PORTR|nr:hypothetical protein [Portunus trituberculatus]